MVLSVRILRRFLGLRAETGACLLSTRATERDRFDRGVATERSGARPQTQTAHREDRARLIADDITKDCLENNKLRMAHTAHGQRCTAGVYNGMYT